MCDEKNRYTDISPLPMFISGCSIIMSSISLLLSDVGFLPLVLVALTSGALICAASGVLLHARRRRSDNSSNESAEIKKQTKGVNNDGNQG